MSEPHTGGGSWGNRPTPRHCSPEGDPTSFVCVPMRVHVQVCGADPRARHMAAVLPRAVGPCAWGTPDMRLQGQGGLDCSPHPPPPSSSQRDPLTVQTCDGPEVTRTPNVRKRATGICGRGGRVFNSARGGVHTALWLAPPPPAPPPHTPPPKRAQLTPPPRQDPTETDPWAQTSAKKKMKMGFLESGCRGGSENASFAMYLV